MNPGLSGSKAPSRHVVLHHTMDTLVMTRDSRNSNNLSSVSFAAVCNRLTLHFTVTERRGRSPTILWLVSGNVENRTQATAAKPTLPPLYTELPLRKHVFPNMMGLSRNTPLGPWCAVFARTAGLLAHVVPRLAWRQSPNPQWVSQATSLDADQGRSDILSLDGTYFLPFLQQYCPYLSSFAAGYFPREWEVGGRFGCLNECPSYCPHKYVSNLSGITTQVLLCSSRGNDTLGLRLEPE